MKYEGILDSRGFKNGFGKLIYENGSIYEGEWKTDKRDGYGKFVDNDQNFYYGYWKKDCKEGKGT